MIILNFLVSCVFRLAETQRPSALRRPYRGTLSTSSSDQTAADGQTAFLFVLHSVLLILPVIQCVSILNDVSTTPRETPQTTRNSSRLMAPAAALRTNLGKLDVIELDEVAPRDTTAAACLYNHHHMDESQRSQYFRTDRDPGLSTGQAHLHLGTDFRVGDIRTEHLLLQLSRCRVYLL